MLYSRFIGTDFLGVQTGLMPCSSQAQDFFFMARCPTFLSAFLVTGCRTLAGGVDAPAGWAEAFVRKQSDVHSKDPVFFSAAGLPCARPASPFVVTSRRVSPVWRDAAGSAGHLADRSGFFTAFP